MSDLPCYEMDQLTEWQLSAPMPARRRARLIDGDVTDALGPEPEAPVPASRGRRPAEPTQPIAQPTTDSPVPGPASANATPLPRIPAPARRRGLAPGEVLCGRYLVEEQVAHYGMGHVYRAIDRNREAAGARDPRVALKFARRSAGNDGETSSLLRQEFLKLSRLRHPNIVDVFDIARDGELEFIVMEWLPGETLAEMLACITSKRIALERATDIVRGTARALAHAHDLGIVHGDVKPSNIFLVNGRSVKVLDFGSSGGTTGSAGERHWATRAYASCDVLEGRPPQPHDDVFALGVTAYCLFSGERPFGELDALEARERGLEPPPLPDDALDKWPAVRQALAFEAIDRTGNARLFLQALEEPADPGTESPRDASTVFYGAVAATVLASIVWWSVDGIDGLPDTAAMNLLRADRALAAGMLVEPQGESAVALYGEVLAADPDNRLALAGLEAVAQRFVASAREAAAAGDVDAARAHLELARRASPEHLGIGLVEDLLATRGRAALLAATHAAETDLERARGLLAEAEAVLPPDDPALAATRAAIAAEGVEHRVGELLREIDERVLSERLTIPTGDSALDLLRRARELAPDDPRLPLAADRIMTALLFQAMFAISDGDLRQAENFLSMARGMNIRHLALARAEYELARARRAALVSRNAAGGN